MTLKATEVYLKIGIYQSVVPIRVCEHEAQINDVATTLKFPSATLQFSFRDSGACETDGIPIWVADDVKVTVAK